MISLLLLAAKCVVAKKWNHSRPPLVKDWYIKIWGLLIADKLLEGILCNERNLKKTCFLEKLYSFFDYLYLAK